jgi:Fe-S oxidoreductase
MREDAPLLLRGELRHQAESVARSCVLFEEFLEEQLAAGHVRLALRAGPPNVLLHGHCHQRAMGLVAPALALASRIPGCTVTEPDAGCCGMAGSFGYVREHYAISRRIAERRLVPAVRSCGPEDAIVAAGTSCRQQLKHVAGVAPVHLAELLRKALDSE